ncbi:hypothetical protein OVA14_03315 [Agrococcus sp. SL85]|uniref:hypothetical protein n=1 Tax=Agrococcus sp. SL85 TaxID=2995141 RepID=UPI00226CC059|nr:hypothetical protein [Agrococcus sp. SL85]WAC66812.1 hypothetical protein OVA14_03315 [Agrococcus sp. SL85]
MSTSTGATGAGGWTGWGPPEAAGADEGSGASEPVGDVGAGDSVAELVGAGAEMVGSAVPRRLHAAHGRAADVAHRHGARGAHGAERDRADAEGAGRAEDPLPLHGAILAPPGEGSRRAG